MNSVLIGMCFVLTSMQLYSFTIIGLSLAMESHKLHLKIATRCSLSFDMAPPSRLSYHPDPLQTYNIISMDSSIGSTHLDLRNGLLSHSPSC